MTFTEDEEKVIEAMARAVCCAEGLPEDELVHGSAGPKPGWHFHRTRARRHYAMQKAMEEAWRMLPHECPACKVLDDCQ